MKIVKWLTDQKTISQIIIPVCFLGVLFSSVMYLTHQPKTPQTPKAPSPQVAQPAPKPQLPWKTIIIQRHQSISHIFRQQKIPSATLVELTRSPVFRRVAKRIKPGKSIELQTNELNQLLGLRYPISRSETLIAKKDEQQRWQIQIHKKPLTRTVLYQRLIIQHSLSDAAKKANLDPNLVRQISQIYGDRINIQRDLRKGDEFVIMYEQYSLDRQPIKSGYVLAAQCQHKNKTLLAIRYQKPAGDVGYYDLSGRNLQNAFARFPCRYRRISSRFNRERMHPRLGIKRPHYGVDFAAPYGTPVHTVANGTVIMARYNGGYGRMVKIRHTRNRMTVYGHLSAFAKGIKRGKKVQRGQIIGYVGSTGLSTGPHLHYELRINRKAFNPLTIKLPAGKNLTASEVEVYLPLAKKRLQQLNEHGYPKPDPFLTKTNAE